MRYGKRYLETPIKRETLEAICRHYDRLHLELTTSSSVVRCGQTEEDILHTAIMCTASLELSDNLGDIISEVRRKYYSLCRGLELEEHSRKELITDVGLMNYADDNEE